MRNNTSLTMDTVWPVIKAKLDESQSDEFIIKTFKQQVQHLVSGKDSLVDQSMIDPLEDVPDLETMDYEKQGEAALDKSVIIKLNGGLGTSMGLEKAKSLITVKDGLSFLDIILQQVLTLRETRDIDLPVIFMNSFNTENDTHEKIEEYPDLEKGQKGIPYSFLQHQVPKLQQDTLQPVDWSENHTLEWCPPGHGDIYTSLVSSGLLQTLLEQGITYAFVSNADNLGATLNTTLLGYMAEKELPFIMEVTDRTTADRKGGHLARNKDGRIILRESAQCPEAEMDDFQNINKYRYFNTNSLWINLSALKTALEENDHVIKLPLIINRKTVNPKNADSPAVFQLETAMGAAIQVFEGAKAVRVPRTRFAPVKTTADLLALWSDLYFLDNAKRLCCISERVGKPPFVDLDSAYYKTFADFASRFPDGAPSMVRCLSLTIKGDVLFEKGVTLSGTINLVNKGNEQARVPEGTIFTAQGEEISVNSDQ